MIRRLRWKFVLINMSVVLAIMFTLCAVLFATTRDSLRRDSLAALEQAILSGADIRADETLGKHADWVDELKTRYTFTPENTADILRREVGAVFAQVLEDAGVFKRNEAGRAAFRRFLGTADQEGSL